MDESNFSTSVATAPHIEQAPDGRDSGATNGRDGAVKGYPRRVKEPRRPEEKFLALMGRATDGTVALPSIKEVRMLAQTRPLEQTLAEFEAVAAQSEERSKAAMTASGFAFTIAGILVATKSHISAEVLAVTSLIAFVGFVAGLLGQGFYVGRRPLHDVNIDDVTNALTFTIHKEFYAQVSMLVASLALSIEILAFAFAYI
ncbi:MAG: hypothetical protein ACLPUT_17365 [Solirubrobacteraceae bacterium]